MTADDQKRAAAEAAIAYLQPGMRLGLGTGSTAAHFVAALGRHVADGFPCCCVPTSEATRVQAAALGIVLTTLDETPELDLTIDGADEIGPGLALIKGGGGALLREKIVAAASRRMMVIADAAKRVPRLGAYPLPVEVNRFGLETTRRAVALVCGGADVTLRRGASGEPFLSDGGHFILDCALGAIEQPGSLASSLHAIPGVVEHGLFIGLCTRALVASDNGVAVLEASA